MVLETRHVPDNGLSDNVHGLSEEELAKRQVIVIDVAKDKIHNPVHDPTQFRSEKTARGPLDPDTWTVTADPVMCCYKLVTIRFQVFGLQSKVEDMIQRNQFDLMSKFHQSIFCLLDEWHGLGMAEVRVLEDEVRDELEERIKGMNLPTRNPVQLEADMAPKSIKSTPF